MPTGISYEPNERDQMLLARGLQSSAPLACIAQVMGLSVPTLRKHYPELIAEAKLKRGPKRFQPSEAQRQFVTIAASGGMQHEGIARLIGISKGSVQTYFPEELRLGMLRVSVIAIKALIDIMTADPPVRGTLRAVIWWTKARMGWKQT